MIRIDYSVQATHVNTTWVSETGDLHSLLGRIQFSHEEWEKTWKALLLTDNQPPFFTFNNKTNPNPTP